MLCHSRALSDASFNKKLKKKYGTGHDGFRPYTYAFSDRSQLSFTPLMLREWAIALVNYCTIVDVLKLTIFTGGECDDHQ